MYKFSQIRLLSNRFVHDGFASISSQIYRRVLDRDQHPNRLRRIDEQDSHYDIGQRLEHSLLGMANARHELRIDGEKSVGGHALQRIRNNLIQLVQDCIELLDVARLRRLLAASVQIVVVGAKVKPKRHHSRQRLVDVLAAVLQ